MAGFGIMLFPLHQAASLSLFPICKMQQNQAGMVKLRWSQVCMGVRSRSTMAGRAPCLRTMTNLIWRFSY